MTHFETGLKAVIADLEVEIADTCNIVKTMRQIGNEEEVRYYEGVRRGLEDALDMLTQEVLFCEFEEMDRVMHPGMGGATLFSHN